MTALETWLDQIDGHLEEMTDGEVTHRDDLEDEHPWQAWHGQGLTAKAAAMQALDDEGIDYDPDASESIDPAKGDPGDENAWDDGSEEVDIDPDEI